MGPKLEYIPPGIQIKLFIKPLYQHFDCLHLKWCFKNDLCPASCGVLLAALLYTVVLYLYREIQMNGFNKKGKQATLHQKRLRKYRFSSLSFLKLFDCSQLRKMKCSSFPKAVPFEALLCYLERVRCFKLMRENYGENVVPALNYTTVSCRKQICFCSRELAG